MAKARRRGLLYGQLAGAARTSDFAAVTLHDPVIGICVSLVIGNVGVAYYLVFAECWAVAKLRMVSNL